MHHFPSALLLQIRCLAPILAVCALVTSGCATPRTTEHPIVRMAQFDLNCPRESLSYTQIDDDTWGVVGCGRRTKYVRLCRQVGQGIFIEDHCRWVAN
jgi:hypothetical protein